MRQPPWLVLIPAIVLGLTGAFLSSLALSKHTGGSLAEAASAVCGTEGGCDTLLNGDYSTVHVPSLLMGSGNPFRPESANDPWTIPIALIGVWYFTAVTTWLVFVGQPSWSYRKLHLIPIAAVVFGCAFSVRFIMLMSSAGTWCHLCLGAHATNFIWLPFVILLWPRKPFETAAEGAASLEPYPSVRLIATTATLAVALCAWFGAITQQPDTSMAESAAKGDATAFNEEIAKSEMASAILSLPLRTDDPIVDSTESPKATMVVFTDLHCQHCQSFDHYLFNTLVPLFEGHLEVTYKHYPLCNECNPLSGNVHPYGCQSAYVAEAARVQGGAEAFKKITKLIKARGNFPWTKVEVFRMAEEIGLDPDQLEQDRKSEAVRRRVAEDVALGNSLEIESTPTAYVNGRMIASESRSLTAFWEAVASTYTGKPISDVASMSNGDGAHANGNGNGHEHTNGSAPHANGDASAPDDGPGADFLPPAPEPAQSRVDRPAGSKSRIDQPFRLSTVDAGDPLALAGPTLDGGHFDLASLHGKVVVVSFTGSWCRLCFGETAYLKWLQQKYGEDGLEIVTVSTDTTRDDVERFVKDNEIDWPYIYVDEDGQRGFYNPLKLQFNIRGLPCQYVVNRDGNVSAAHVRGRTLELAVAEALGVEPAAEDVAETRVAEIAATMKHFPSQTSPPLPSLETGIVPLIDGPTIDGSPFDVSQWRGKHVLVAFWASWCPNCQQEMKTVLDDYNRYHADGFEVVGVSGDQTQQALVDYVKEHHLPWPQIYFDEDGLRGSENPVFQRYNVRKVPTFVLLDPDGRIIDVSADASTLRNRLDSVFGSTSSASAAEPVNPQPQQ